MIKGLHIKNYRAFREFKLDKLARVNLIVGRNNTGKTSLLDFIYEKREQQCVFLQTDWQPQTIVAQYEIARFEQELLALCQGINHNTPPFKSIAECLQPNQGSGVHRLLALGIVALHSANNVLLIEHIDRQLHYSVQYMLWEFLIEKAQTFDVQVFATTHSWDAVQAFQEALEQSKEQVDDINELGQLIRLDRKKDDTIEPVFYPFDSLSVAVEEGIEVC